MEKYKGGFQIKMKIKIVIDKKNNTKYKSLLIVFYGLILLVSIKQIIALFTESLLKPSQLISILSAKWSFQAYINPLIGLIIIILSIIIIILVFKKKLPKFNLVYPIYYLFFIIVWTQIIPYIFGYIASSSEEFLYMLDNQNKFFIIHLIVEFLFSSWFLLKLFGVIKNSEHK